MTAARTTVGWWNPQPWNSRAKFHYIGEDGLSLCGRWAMLAGTIDSDDKDEHSDNCAACKKRVAIRRALGEKEA